MAKITLIDLAKRTGNDSNIGIVESMTQSNPFWNVAPVRPIVGSMFKYQVRTGLPTFGFRAYNGGVTSEKSKIKDVFVECKPMGGHSSIDKSLAEAYPGGVAEFRAMEDASFIAAGANTFCSKMYYGNSGTTAPELDGIGTILSTLAGTCVGAGGSTGSSMYFFSFENAVDVSGNLPGVDVPIANGKLPSATDLGLQMTYQTGSTTAQYAAYTTWFDFQPGLGIYDSRSIGRIANIDSTHKPTIALINQVLTAMHPYRCSLITCSKTVFNYVQELKGASAFQQTSPYESDELFKRAAFFNGVPIMIDESISDSESAIS